MGYRPIQSYGVIGNLRTAALISTEGSVDWLCLPHFDSPSVFGAILDDKKGGSFTIRPEHDGETTRQMYFPETNVLLTRFLGSDGVGEIADFMPVGVASGVIGQDRVVRRVKVARGVMKFLVSCRPAFNYGRDPHEVSLEPRCAIFRSPRLSLALTTPIALRRDGDFGVAGEFTLKEGEQAVFLLGLDIPGCRQCPESMDDECERMFAETVQYWRHWLSQCTYRGRWREMVVRSALALKLLTFEPTGAIVAAPTCSLPEVVGGGRNWDYRYTWIRDAAFTLYALLRIGFTDEATNFMRWLEARCHEIEPDGSLQIVYGIDGRHELKEEVLDHLEGYRGSGPVRIGNGAYHQLQLDIYGELMDAIYLYNKYGMPISYDLWIQIRKLLDWLCDNWTRTDEGIWEVRSGQRHFVYSKLMCWVALDRGLRLAEKRSFPVQPERWLEVRNRIYEKIMSEGWNPERQSFVQTLRGNTLDASNLIMPLIFFVSPTDPRMLKTLAATLRSPSQGGLLSDSLVFRYNASVSPDGLTGQEGTFNICTFWLVEALTRAGKADSSYLERARLLFEQMLGYANHVGLYSEQVGPSGEALGNFPQAFTHIALISAAVNLDRVLGGKRD